MLNICLFFAFIVEKVSFLTSSSSSSSSSSDTVQGSVLLPHYRTLEVRPGRISYKLNYDYGSKEMM